MLPWKSNTNNMFWVCVCTLKQHATRTHRMILSFVDCLALPHFFPHYPINGTTFRKNTFNIKRMFWFTLHLLSKKISHYKKTSARYCRKCTQVFMWSIRFSCKICRKLYFSWGHAVAQWLRHCATNRKVAGSIPDGAIGIFNWHNPSGRTTALGSSQPLTEISTRIFSWGKGGRWVGLTILPPSCANCLKNLGASTSWNPQGLSRPVMGLLYP
jgi:hypothetical protein